MTWANEARTAAVSILALTAAAWGAQAQTVEPAPLEAYGALPAMEMVDLSPNGDRLAYVTVVGENRSLLVTDTAGELLGGARAGDTKVRSINWVGQDHLLVVMTSTEAVPDIGLRRSEVTRGQIYDIEARTLRPVLAGTRGVVPLIFGGPYIRNVDGQPTVFVESALFRRGGYDGMNLYAIDLSNGRGRAVEEWGNNRPDFTLGQNGRAIARGSYFADTGRWALSTRKGSFWEPSWSTTALLDQPFLSGMGRTPDTVVLYADRDEGQRRFHEVNVTTGEWSDFDFSRAPDGFWRHPVSDLVIGARYTQGDVPEYEFIDPLAERTWRSVAAAFPQGNPSIVSWSDDMRSVVVFTQGDGDSGTYMLVDLDNGSASVIGEEYPTITGDKVGDVRAVRYAAADGMEIPGYLTLPPGVTEPRNLPLVVLPHGGPAARDTLRFDWWAQAIASRGYVVLQPNFRGSDGLGDAHREAGYGEWGRKMQSDLSDGVRWLASEGMIDPARVCIVGASYGGYAALAGPTLDPGVYRCAVSVAGVSDLRTMVEWSRRGGERNSPVVRYWNRFMGADRLGDRSLDERSPRQQAAQADAPILLLHGWDDTVVPYEQSRFMAEALQRAGKPHELIRLDGEDHWLSRGETRLRMLQETVRWLETHNPAN